MVKARAPRSALVVVLLVLVGLAGLLGGCPRPLGGPSEDGRAPSSVASFPVPADAVVVARAARLDEAAPALAPLALATDALGPLTPLLAGRLLDEGTRLGGLVGLSPSGPVWISVRPDGGRVLALPSTDASRFLATTERALSGAGVRVVRSVGSVRAFVDARGEPLLLATAFAQGVLLAPAPKNALDTAALLDVMARGEGRAASLPGGRALAEGDAPDVEVFARGDLGALGLPVSGLLGDLGATGGHAALDVEDGRLIARARLSLDDESRASLAAAFAEAAPLPPGSCAIEGALLSARLPAGLAGALEGDAASGGERLQGQVGLSLHPAKGATREPRDPLSYVSALVLGTPKDAAARDALATALLADGPAASREETAGRVVHVLTPEDGAAHRTVRAVVDDEVFALSLGAGRALDDALSSVGRCSSGAAANDSTTNPAPLALHVDVAGLARALAGATPDERTLPGRVASVLARFSASLAGDVSRVDASATFEGGELGVKLTAELPMER